MIEKEIEKIEKRNIEENMQLAYENHPEGFAQVSMLWINVKVNGHHFKGLLKIFFLKMYVT